MRKIIYLSIPLLILSARTRALALPITFNYTGSVQTWTVPTTSQYEFVAIGGSGGTGNLSGKDPNYGGLAAQITVDFNLTANTVLNFYVGGQGGSTTGNQPGGGGGGTFVTFPGSDTPLLLVAGGGGGGGVTSDGSAHAPAVNGPVPTDGGDAPGYFETIKGGTAGSNGNGGNKGEGDSSISATRYGGGGGGGVYSNGTGGSVGSDTGGGGFSLGSGLAGGSSGGSGAGGAGGYGGGGGGGQDGGGGGGGGYGGGGGGAGGGTGYAGPGGFGGSYYNVGSFVSLTSALNLGNGSVTITAMDPTTQVPEPASLALLGISMLGLMVARHRGRRSA